ncbi:MAG: proline--tRNA ligase [Gammaproteobacteria bacterium]|nr:proline--tRNA ligase [Gammaproteobacteria bacterium]
MLATQVLAPTLRDDPANADVVSHKLLLRAGFIRQLGSGLFTWLPLGLRVIHNVEKIVREELNRTGAQEVLMPVVQPAEIWEESGRWAAMGPELLRIIDRHERHYCFSPTHEEVVTDVLRQTIDSYRDLPLNLYQINTKFRDEIRPRFGLMRAREFIMKDGYSFHVDDASLDETYQAIHGAYSGILDRIGLLYRSVQADSGMMGGSDSEEFHVLADSGEDLIAYSPNSGYGANVERAEALILHERAEPQVSLTRVETPNAKTIEDVSALLDIPATRCVKTLMVHGTDSLIALILRGDHQLNEIKAAHLDGVVAPLRFATDDEISSSLNVDPGSIGPVDLGVPYIVDRSADVLSDFVCGANENGFHLTGVNWVRDAPQGRVEDLRNVEPGDQAPDGSGPLSFTRGIEVGHIFKLGRKYTEAMNVTVQTSDGDDLFPTMGCYGLGVSRLVAAVVEQCHDDKGILWPRSVAPALLHIVTINQHRSSSVEQVASDVYRECQRAGIEVFWDDRDERPGVKFNDAELIGIPYRVTIGERGLKQGNVEIQEERGESMNIRPDEVVGRLISR